MVKKLVLLLAVVLSLALFARRAESYERLEIDRHLVRFTTEIRYYSDLEDSLVNSLENSLSKWNTAADGILTWSRVDDPLDANLIYTYGRMTDDFLALASVLDGHVDGSEFRVDRGLIQINSATILLVENMDSLVLHELGHIFGLSHPALESASDKPTMCAFQASSSEELNTLHSDDVDGIREIFGLSPLELEPLSVDCKKNRFTVRGADASVYWTVYDRRGRSVANFRGTGIKVRVPSRGRLVALWNGRTGTWRRGW